jgi:pyridoxamine 5'-phosphate oxidase-like protein
MQSGQTPKQPKASRPHMPGYGIMDADKGSGLLPWSWATQRLEKAKTYWISSTRPDGRPHTMPVWGVWLDTIFCFSTGKDSRKARNLALNPNCVTSCEVGDVAIILEGVAELVSDPGLRKSFASVYGSKYNWDTEGFDEPVYVVRPSVAFAFSCAPGEFTASATRWTFED